MHETWDLLHLSVMLSERRNVCTVFRVFLADAGETGRHFGRKHEGAQIQSDRRSARKIKIIPTSTQKGPPNTLEINHLKIVIQKLAQD
jgi:hypothetical protein